ncbi:MAG: Spy/CpxP family protein refolding chaperone [Alphaproteobacteria bacterium]|nr:Spy/CpxP family protein refolding chaperone [Alphaproteobacteria bacterium]
MKTTTKILAVLAVATTVIAVPALADANHHKDGNKMPMGSSTMMGSSDNHMTGSGMMGSQMMGGSMMSGSMMGAGMLGLAKFNQAEFDKLKEKLGITPSQEEVWSAYVNTLKETTENAQAQHESMDRDSIHKMDEKDRWQLMETMMEARSEDAKAVVTSRDALFAVLTDKQKELAPTLTSARSTYGHHDMMHRMMAHAGGGHSGMGSMMGGGIHGYGVTSNKDLSLDNVRDIFEGKLAFSGNKRMKVGNVAKVDDDTYSVEIMTVDNSLVSKYTVDRQTGRITRAN